MIRPEFKYGLSAGAGISLWFYAEFLFGLHTTRLELGESTGKLSTVVLIIALWRILAMKQKALGPAFSLPRGLLTGFLTSLVAAVVIYIFQSFYSQFINPGWLDAALKWKVAQLRADHLSEEAIRAQIALYRQLNSPGGMLIFTVLNWSLQGAVMSVFLTLWLKWQARKAR